MGDIKAIFFDLEDVIIRMDYQKFLWLFKRKICRENPEFMPAIKRLNSMGVRLYAISRIKNNDLEKILTKFPHLRQYFKSIIFTDESSSATSKKEFWSKTLDTLHLKAYECLYYYNCSQLAPKDDDVVYTFLNQEIGIDALGYDKNSRIAFQLHTRLVAKGVYWPNSRSPNKRMSDTHKELCIKLLVYISKRLCRNFTDWQYEESSEAWQDHNIFKNYNKNSQYNATKGALVTNSGISAWERACSCLERWGIIKHFAINDYEITYNTSEIHKIVKKHKDANMEMFAWTLETFFDCDVQVGWDECAYEGDKSTYVQVSDKIIYDFLNLGLVNSNSEKLVWSEEMEPYKSCMLGSALLIWPEGNKYRPEEAQEFFDRICIHN